MIRDRNCRHCGERFAWYPGKPGYVDECPECLCARAIESQPKPRSALRELLEYMAAHPLTVRLDNGHVLLSRTEGELRAKLRRKNIRAATIQKLMLAYREAVLKREAASVQS